MITEEIERGIAYLDSVDPDWRSRVDVSTLDMRQDQHDVLAQVMGVSYYDAVVAATMSTGDSWGDTLDRWGIEHGFTLPLIEDEDESEEAWAELTDAWREVVLNG